jgi:transglutaminase-like putative cysteine protease
MKAIIIICLLFFLSFFIWIVGEPQEIIDFGSMETKKSPPTKVYLRKATGDLGVEAPVITETYEAYFHIPISFQEQVPILIEVESPDLIDYRFVHLNPPNVIIAARMKQAEWTELKWTAWVLVKENTYSDLPYSVPIPNLEELPKSVRKWLLPTDCSQISAQIVKEKAESVRGTTTDLMKLANDICSFCYEIPWNFPHWPMAFDAVYALKWGNSCTGHAHAGAALFRANGIPARSLLNIPVGSSGSDMHWIVDYYVPDYGWVRMETSSGKNPIHPEEEIVTFASNPEDEFCLFFPCAIDGCWHTSDPALGMWRPDWAGAHRAFDEGFINYSSDEIELAHSITNSVFFYYSRYWGIKLTPAQKVSFQYAHYKQKAALTDLQNSNLDGYMAKMQQALTSYQKVDPEPIMTIFSDDFESGTYGWSHGGYQDEWELGKPAYGPAIAHSGEHCWGLDLDNTYEDNAECWLMSPSINLSNKSCAYVSFWVWNSVQDRYGTIYDPLWLDITDGATFYPLCSKMGGINDDPEIPDVGGWSRVVLDLHKYLGNTVQIRFRFRSNSYTVWPGPYIDDVHVYGRALKKYVPRAPKDLKAKAKTWKKIKLRWKDKSRNEDGFRIERRMGKKGGWLEIATAKVNTKIYVDKGLEPNTTYHYRILAFNSNGNSDYSNIAKAKTKRRPQKSLPCYNLFANDSYDKRL